MARGINDILTDRRVLDWGDKILTLEPDATPLVVLSKKLGKEKADNQKYINFEDRPYTRWFYCDTPTGDPLTKLTLELTSGGGENVAAAAYIQVRDLLYCPEKDHTMIVTGVNTGNGEVTVTEQYAGQGEGGSDGRVYNSGDTSSDTHAPPVAQDRIVKMSNVYPNGGVSATAHALALTSVYNFIQKFQLAFDLDEETMIAELEGGPELKRLQGRKAVEHLKNLEYQFLLGDRDARLEGGKMIYTTAGLYHSGLTTDTVATADFNETAFRSFLRSGFGDEMSKRKLLIAGGQVVEAIDAWAMGRLVINDKLSATLGMEVPAYKTTFGTVDIVYHPLLKNSFEGWAFLLDMNYIKYKKYGPDTELQTALQANDAQERKDQYLTRCGFKISLLETHRMLKVT